MKSLLISTFSVALLSLAACSHKAGHHEHSCQGCQAKAEQSAEKKSCTDGACALDKKCEACNQAAAK